MIFFFSVLRMLHGQGLARACSDCYVLNETTGLTAVKLVKR